jgi:hypothetical protein
MTTLVAGLRPVRPRAQVGPIPFGRLVRVEWGKTVGTRAARWLIGAVAVMIVLAMAVPLAFPRDVEQTRTVYLSFAALGEGLLLPVVPILAMTGEWTQHTALVTFTQEPRRGRVLGAKLAAGLILGAVVAAFALAAGLAAVAAAGAAGRAVHGDRAWLALLVGFVLCSLLYVVMGMAFGALLHNSAAAIVLFYLLPTLWSIVFSVRALAKVGEWLDTSKALSWVQEADWSDHVGKIATSVLLWIVVPLAAGLVRTLRRDVS